MPSPITEVVIIIAIIAISIVTTAVMYLLVLARMGTPLNVQFRGYGIDLEVGQRIICKSSAGDEEEVYDEKTKTEGQE